MFSQWFPCLKKLLRKKENWYFIYVVNLLTGIDNFKVTHSLNFYKQLRLECQLQKKKERKNYALTP